MRQFSIRSLLGLSMLALVVLPAIGAAYLLVQRDLTAVDAWASRSLQDGITRAQAEIQDHFRQATRALDSMAPPPAGEAQKPRPTEWVSDPALFAPMAIALTRSSPDLRFVYFTGTDGRAHGVENAPEGLRFGGRGVLDAGERVLSTSNAQAPRTATAAADDSGDTNKDRAWIDAAMKAKGRVFSPVALSPVRRQLLLTVSQPVLDKDGVVLGVIGVDLALQALSSRLRALPVSPNAAIFLIDENGHLIASNGDSQVIGLQDGRPVLRTPLGSTNPVVRTTP